MKLKHFLVTFHLPQRQLEQIICEESLPVLRNKLTRDIADRNIDYIKIDGTIIFTRHIKSFHIQKIYTR
ncbi:hypothetical protein BACCIP111899_01581 [Bacillus rhizoplanae]|uniref:Uncharacterized protein n=1 Tax=Bacillus rhizoplanae TaxID=2880966 RepID=A0ABM8Y9I4_9BACI|nr:hypothetical protein [Bacillus rhizoplanae]CAG9612405.1 hypothetical protein BACCIP111899_01581 [Bacillus rhizoplanae]